MTIIIRYQAIQIIEPLIGVESGVVDKGLFNLDYDISCGNVNWGDWGG